MIRVAILVVCAAGCASPACPSADSVARATNGSATDMQDYAIMSSRCVADHWSAAVVGCIRKAASQDDLESCLKQLTPEQAQQLKAELKAADAPELAASRAKTADREQHQLDEYLDGLPATLFAESTECTAYRRAISSTFVAALGCGRGELEVFGGEQLVRRQVKELGAIATLDGRRAACTRYVVELGNESELQCR